MKPSRDSEDTQPDIYQDVENHSDGMISFTYRPPTTSDLDPLKHTKTYQSWLREHPEGIVQSTDKPVSNE